MVRMLERVKRFARGEDVPRVARLVGFRLAEHGDGTARVELDADERHHNPMGLVHGGVLCDIADGAMGSAFATVLDESESFTTLEIKINFLRPVIAGLLVAQARVVQAGRTIGLVECDVRDRDEHLVAHATCTVLRVPGGGQG